MIGEAEIISQPQNLTSNSSEDTTTSTSRRIRQIIRQRMRIMYQTLVRVIIGFTILNQVSCQNDSLIFLTEGNEIRYATRSRNVELGIMIKIEFDATTVRQLLNRFDTDIIGFINNYPAFSADAEFGQKYRELITVGSVETVLAAETLEHILEFKSTENKPSKYSCEYTHEYLDSTLMTAQVNGLLDAKTKIGTWSKTDILSDPVKDQALRLFALNINELGEDWKELTLDMINALDLLANHKFPEDLRGAYKKASCISKTTIQETVEVNQCWKTRNGYYCSIEVIEPMQTVSAIKMHTISYNNIKIISENDEEMFIKTTEVNSELCYLDCEDYVFNSEKVPICEKRHINKECAEALNSRHVRNAIHNCNFSRDAEPQVILRTLNEGILIQGEEVIVERKVNNEFMKISDETPILVYSPTDLLVKKNEEIWEIAAANTGVQFKIIKTALTQDDLKALKSRVFWLEVRDFFDSETTAQLILIIATVIGLPATICGIGLSFKNKAVIKTLMSMIKDNAEKGSKKKRSKKEKYKDNKMALQKMLNPSSI